MTLSTYRILSHRFQYPSKRVILPDLPEQIRSPKLTRFPLSFQYPSKRVILPDQITAFEVMELNQLFLIMFQYPSKRVILPDP